MSSKIIFAEMIVGLNKPSGSKICAILGNTVRLVTRLAVFMLTLYEKQSSWPFQTKPNVFVLSLIPRSIILSLSTVSMFDNTSELFDAHLRRKPACFKVLEISLAKETAFILLAPVKRSFT